MNITYQELSKSEWPSAFTIMVQLRSSHTLDTFLASVSEQSESLGYKLYGAFQGNELLAVAGARPVVTLARGRFLHVDDLVVDEDLRVKGIGRGLLEHLHSEAREQSMSFVFLDARPEAKGFYDSLGYGLHGSPSMKLALS